MASSDAAATATSGGAAAAPAAADAALAPPEAASLPREAVSRAAIALSRASHARAVAQRVRVSAAAALAASSADPAAPAFAELAAADVALAAADELLAAAVSALERARADACTDAGASAGAGSFFVGPAADSRLGELLVDVLGIVAAVGFACEVSHCLYLCGATWREGDKGATNDMLVRSMEKQGWAALLREARAAKRHGSKTQLMRAAAGSDLPRTLQLLRLGAPLELRDANGYTALLIACYNGREAVAKALLDGEFEGCGARVDAHDTAGWTSLILASTCGHEGVVRLLLARGANVAMATHTKVGRTALSEATFNRRAACAALLRAHGALT